MSKSHRDNTKARKKRGQVAFDKRKKRREFVPKCKTCGTKSRAKVLVGGFCPLCLERFPSA